LVKINYKEIKCKYKWFFFPCDEILRKSFNPIIYFLKNYFKQSENNNRDKNLIIFERIYKELIDKADDKEELIRIKSIIGSLVNLYWKDSLYEQLDGKGRYENILYGMKNLIKVESLETPIIIELEDSHVIDQDTKRFFEILTKNVDNIPIIIITTCRLRDDGSEFNLKLENIEKRRINLKYLNNEGIIILIKRLLKVDNIPLETLNIISRESEGNPFYIDQIIKYLKENKLIDKKLKLKVEKFEIPHDINSIIIARVDKLTTELKEVVQTASVIGRKFAVDVLRKMLKNRSIDKLLIEGENKSIYYSLSELIYIFKHALIKESIYQMQLKEKLRTLHKLAAETIEDLYKDNLEQHYSELANHYERAQIREKTVEYLKKTSKYAENNYKNEEALKAYNSLISYTDDISEKIVIYNKQIYILLNMGEINKAEHLIQKALDLDKEIKKYRNIVKIFGGKAHIYIHKGKFEMAKQVIDRALKIPNIRDEDKADIYRIYALYLSFSEKDKKAFIYFKKALYIYRKVNNRSGIANCLSDIPTFCGLQLGLEKALIYLNNALDIFKENNNLRGVSMVMSNIAVVYDEVYMDLDKALNYYLKSIEINKKIGNMMGIMNDTNNIGSIYRLKKNYKKAFNYYDQSLKMTLEIGDINARANTLANLTIYYRDLKNYKKAEMSINKAIKIVKGLKMKIRYYKFLNEKVILYYDMKLFDKAQKINKEILIIAKDTKNKEIENTYIMNKSKIDFKSGDNIIAIENLNKLFKKVKSKQQKADITYILWECTKEERFRKKALKYYEKLCDEIEKDFKEYINIERLNKLRNICNY